jgi:hypothetical protein
MLRTIEAVIEPDGRVRLLEPLSLTTAHRALVTVLEESGDDEAGGNVTALRSEQALAAWNSDEEDAAWVGRDPGNSAPRGMSGEKLRSLVGSISPEDLDVMERVIEDEFERIDPHGW